MTACKLYLILSAVGVLIFDRISPLFSQSYGVWAVPLVFIGFFVAFVLLQLLTLVLMILFTSIKKAPKGEHFFRFLIKHSLPIVLSVMRVEFNFEGLDKMDDNENMLFVCNHQHDLDPAVIISAFPDKKLSFIGKKEILVELPFIAKAMHLLSCLFIDRENDREGAKTIITAIKYLKSGERSVAVFPEGYTSKTEELLPFRNGSLKMALKSKKPVAVCVLHNTKRITKNMFRRKTVVSLRLIEVIRPEFFENKTTADLGDTIHKMLEENLEEIKKQSV